MSEGEISAAIEVSRVQGWLELKDGAEDDGVAVASYHDLQNQVVWEELKRRDPRVFLDMGERLKLGRVIAEGGQAHIYKASINGSDHSEYVAKAFKMDGFSLADLQRQWPRTTKPPINCEKTDDGFVLNEVVFGEIILYCCAKLWGTLLKDGRFVFVIRRYWGDLRTFINMRLSDNNSQGPPFSHFQAVRIIYDIVLHMSGLHDI